MSATDQALGAAAFALGALIDPVAWILAVVLAWCALPRWWLVALLGLVPTATSIMLAASIAPVRLPTPTTGQWLAVLLAGLVMTMAAAGVIRWHQKRGL